MSFKIIVSNYKAKLKVTSRIVGVKQINNVSHDTNKLLKSIFPKTTFASSKKNIDKNTFSYWRLLISIINTAFFLFFFSLVGAIRFPAALPSGSSFAVIIGIDLSLRLLPIIVLNVVAYILARGVMSIKNPIIAIAGLYISTLVLGCVLLAFTIFNFP